MNRVLWVSRMVVLAMAAFGFTGNALAESLQTSTPTPITKAVSTAGSQTAAMNANSVGREFTGRLNGYMWRLEGDTNHASCTHDYFEMQKDQLIYVRILDDAHARNCPFKRVAGRRWQMGAQKLSAPDFFYETTDGRSFAGTISEDGRTITIKVPDNIPPPGSSPTGFNTRILFRKVN